MVYPLHYIDLLGVGFFSPFSSQDYAIKAEIDLRVTTIYLRRTKTKTTLSSTGERQTTQIQVAAGKPGCPGGEVERAVHKVRRLR